MRFQQKRLFYSILKFSRAVIEEVYNSHYEKLPNGEVRCIDDEIPFEIPSNWCWVRLSQVVQINPKNKADDNIEAAFIPMELIDATYFSSFTFETKKWKTIKGGFTHFADGDIAFAKITPCFQNRKSMILRNLPNGIGAGTTELKVLRPYARTINDFYLLFFLESAYFVEQAAFKGTANQQRIISGYMENKLFPLPPIDEQERIAEKLKTLLLLADKYGESQTALNKLNDELPQIMKQSILQEAIQGRLVEQYETDEPAEALLQRIKKEKERLVVEGKLKRKDIVESTIYRGDDNKYYEKCGNAVTCIDDEIPFDLPKTWQWIRGNAAFLPMQSTKPKGETFTYIDIDAVNNRLNIIDKAKNLPTKQAPSRATRKLHKNDVLFSMVRPYLRNIALVSEINENVIASTGFYVISPTCAYNPRFLFYLMISPYVVEGLNEFMKGDNSPSINNYDIEHYLYPLPPLAEQQRIVTKLEHALASIMSR